MIIGFSIDSMEAGKDQMRGGETDINYTSSLTGVEDAEIESLDDTVARISFELGLGYRQDEEDVADMSFEGSVLWRGDDAEDLIDSWEENEEIDEDVAAQVTNHVYRKCLTRAVGMADALELPSPVPMPRVNR